MALNPDQTALILEKLNKFWPMPRKCPLCEFAQWDLGVICELREFNQGNLVVGGPVTPLIVVHCSRCGGTQMFNAIRLGLIDPLTGQIIGLPVLSGFGGAAGAK